MSMSASSSEAQINQLVEELLPTESLKPEIHADGEDAILYRLLDEAKHGRKLMNYLLFSNSSAHILDFNSSAIHRTSICIGKMWFDEEKSASTQTTPAAMQLETPVIFSWSKKVHDERKEQNSVRPRCSPVRETTNNKLYKTAAVKLDNIEPWEKWNEPLRLSTIQDDGELSQRSQWANSSFKVDPLQPFVAKLVKEPKKKVPKKEKSPSKMKNLFSFLSSSKKDKVEHIDSQPKSQEGQQNEVKEEKRESAVAKDTTNPTSDVEELDQEVKELDKGIELSKEIEESASNFKKEPTITDIGMIEQVSLPSSQNTEIPPHASPLVPITLPTMQSPDANSPLSMDSFIPLKPKKKN
ncbi:YML037C [Zygosaccharomyces parabailii]|nr:YML037C [Zygosaccharomyces parabailii]